MPPSSSFNLREEYAGAFRTKSYIDFFAGVLDFTLAHGAALRPQHSSSVAVATASSFRLLADHLLEPDQPTSARLLSLALSRRPPPPASLISLLSDFFSLTADASLLCSILLKDLDFLHRHLRRPADDLFISLFTSIPHLHTIQTSSGNLFRRIERRRLKTHSKLRCLNLTKNALSFILLVITASSSAIGANMAVHALAAGLILPALPSTRWLAGALSELDAAAKGTYILNRDLDTISRLVARLRDEVEHMATLRPLSGEGKEEGEADMQIRRPSESFRRQMDELEEHLYLCFMTINRARSMVTKEVMAAMGLRL